MRLSVFALTVFASASSAADWPQWRGPNRDGKSGDTGLLATWPEGGPKLVWKLDNVGMGYGQVAVVGDRVYLIGSDANKIGAKEHAACLSATDGKELWRTPFETAGDRFSDGWGGGPRATPTVTGGKLFALGVAGDLRCLDAASGKLLWARNLVKDFSGTIPNWGYSESPLVDGGNVIVTPGGKGGMVALKADSGDVAWMCEGLKDKANYSSVVATDIGGVRVYVQQTADHAIGVRATDGKLLFSTGELNRATAVIPTPVVAGDLAFFTSGYGAGCECYRLSADGNGGVAAKKVYSKNSVLENHHGGVVEKDGFVYGHSNRNGWVCFDYKKGPGEATWANQGPGKGSISYAEGHFYLYGESGVLVRIKATSDGYQEAGKLTIPAKSDNRGRRSAVWPHPVIANGKLYLRDYELLYVYDLGGKVAGK